MILQFAFVKEKHFNEGCFLREHYVRELGNAINHVCKHSSVLVHMKID